MRKEIIRLPVDERNRVTLSRLLSKDERFSSFTAYREKGRFILEPNIEIPLEEVDNVEDQIILSEKNWSRFEEILDAPVQKNENLKRAFEKFSAETESEN